MRTQISIPQPVSEAAQQMARDRGMSVSELYTVAIVAYVTQHEKGNLTEMLNRVYDSETSMLEPELITLQVASLRGEAW